MQRMKDELDQILSTIVPSASTVLTDLRMHTLKKNWWGHIATEGQLLLAFSPESYNLDAK